MLSECQHSEWGSIPGETYFLFRISSNIIISVLLIQLYEMCGSSETAGFSIYFYAKVSLV